jgi:hypothetical protein
LAATQARRLWRMSRNAVGATSSTLWLRQRSPEMFCCSHASTYPFFSTHVRIGLPLLRTSAVLHEDAGQLHDSGNTTTLAHYLELLGGSGLL